jgi:hypothetical protein
MLRRRTGGYLAVVTRQATTAIRIRDAALRERQSLLQPCARADWTHLLGQGSELVSVYSAICRKADVERCNGVNWVTYCAAAPRDASLKLRVSALIRRVRCSLNCLVSSLVRLIPSVGERVACWRRSGWCGRGDERALRRQVGGSLACRMTIYDQRSAIATRANRYTVDKNPRQDINCPLNTPMHSHYLPSLLHAPTIMH